MPLHLLATILTVLLLPSYIASLDLITYYQNQQVNAIFNNLLDPQFDKKTFTENPYTLNQYSIFIDKTADPERLFYIVLDSFSKISIRSTHTGVKENGFDYTVFSEIDRNEIFDEPSEIKYLTIKYDCKMKESWGDITLEISTQKLYSMIPDTFKIQYRKVCNTEIPAKIDLGHFFGFSIFLGITYYFSRSNWKIIFDDHRRCVSPFYLILFFGSIITAYFILLFLRIWLPDFLNFTILFASFSALFLTGQVIMLRLTKGRLRKYRVHLYLNLEEILIFSLTSMVCLLWCITNSWLLTNIIFFSILFIMLWVIEIKQFNHIFMLSILMLLFDSFWVYFLPKKLQSAGLYTLLGSMDYPFRLVTPRLRPNYFHYYVFWGMGDFFMLGLMFKFARRLDKQLDQEEGKLVIGIAVGATLGFLICIGQMFFRGIEYPVSFFFVTMSWLVFLIQVKKTGRVKQLLFPKRRRTRRRRQREENNILGELGERDGLGIEMVGILY